MTELVQHLVDSRIAGNVATPRESNLRNIRRMLAGESEYWFGVHLTRDWSSDEVLEVMARRCGVDPDPEHVVGQDTIDPGLTVAQLERWRKRLALAAERRERVVLATGHPTGILAIHLEVAAALRRAGCEVLQAGHGWSWPWDTDWGRPRPRHVRFLGGVAVMASGGELLHTHRPEPMAALLADLPEPPDLVVADHGWAGTAAQQGIETLGMADCNDPALFIAEEQGLPIVTVPLDDNVRPHLYAPLAEALLAGW